MRRTWSPAAGLPLVTVPVRVWAAGAPAIEMIVNARTAVSRTDVVNLVKATPGLANGRTLLASDDTSDRQAALLEN